MVCSSFWNRRLHIGPRGFRWNCAKVCFGILPTYSCNAEILIRARQCGHTDELTRYDRQATYPLEQGRACNGHKQYHGALLSFITAAVCFNGPGSGLQNCSVPHTSFRPFADLGYEIKMLRCGPPNRTFAAIVKSARGKLTDYGLCGLLHVRLLLTQHFLATAAYFMPGCSPSRGSGHSMIPTSVDSRPTLRCILYELTEG